MFINIVRCDLNNGILKKWKFYLFTGAFFSILAIFAYETGKLQIADWALIGKNDDFIAYLDQQLLMDTDERVDSILSSISTASGKEIEIKLPYPLIYMDKEKEIDRNMPYKIAVTKYPSRKYIQFG